MNTLTSGMKKQAELYKAKHGIYPDWYTAFKKSKRAPVALSSSGRQESANDELEREFADQIIGHGLPRPETQYRWFPGRNFRCDFAYPDIKLIIEIQGGIYSEGPSGHNGAAFEQDRAKYAEAQLIGWRVLEFGPKAVRDGIAIEFLKRALNTFTPQENT